MAETITSYGEAAGNRSLPHAGEFGNQAVWHGQIELAAAAQNEVHAIAKVPMGAYLMSFTYHHDAMGANTGLKFGLQTSDGTTISDDDYFATVANASTAGNGIVAVALQGELDQDAYIIVKQTGTGTGTGTVQASVSGIWTGHP